MQPRRIQLKRTKGWRKPPNTVVVSRPSRWGNPFNWMDYPDDGKFWAVQRFNHWLDGWYPDTEPERRQWIIDHLHELRGKNLTCWCKPDEPCHADVLLRLANEAQTEAA